MMAKDALSGKVLIVQNKGGGHGTVGYQLCKELLAANPDLQLTVLQDKECNYEKPPFSSYDELKTAGVNIVDANISDGADVVLPDGFKTQGFDYIVDNWSKGEENANFVVDIAKTSNAKQLLFVSSAGMYKPSGQAPHVETDDVKENGPRKVELTVEASGIPYTFMRPQYIYGPKISKRYLDYFVGRAYRKLPIPLPLTGEQLVCLTHIEDVASLIAAAVGHPNAMNQVFNCGTDKYVSYKGIAELFHDALGNDDKLRQYMYYDPLDFSHWKGGFPFRRDTFITTPSKAKQLLDWVPKYAFDAVMAAAELADYKANGDADKEWTKKDLSNDLEVMASKDETFMFDYPFFDNLKVE